MPTSDTRTVAPPAQGLPTPEPHVSAPAEPVLAVYFAADRESAEIRAAHLRSVMRLTPAMMVANVADAALVAWSFHEKPPSGLWAWVGLVCALAGLGLAGWWRGRHRPMTTASPRAVRRSAVHAGLLGLVWALLPALWFAQAPPQQQLLIATSVTGMIGAGGFALARLPLASAAYVGALTLGAMLALAQVGGLIYAAVAGLLLCYVAAVGVGVAGLARQATALLRARSEAARQGRMVALLLRDFEENASEALWEMGPDGLLSHVSPRLAELLGSSPAQLQGQPLLRLLHSRSPQAAATLGRTMAERHSFRDLRITVPLAGQPRHWALSAKRVIDDEGRNTGWRGVLADVTAEAQAQERLHEMAHTDALTGLANRRTLHEELQQALKAESSGALLALDLDHFKAINDTLGHSAGDAVLQAVAQRLRGCTRPGDTVARLGGDEFAVLCSGAAAAAEAQQLAQRCIAALQAPVPVGERSLRVGVSVGVALWQPPVPTVDELLVQADLALYDAKDGGRGRHALYTARLGERSTRRSALEQGLRQHLDSGQFRLVWQAQVDVQRQQITGAEALLRWDHPALGRVLPSEFIAVAEQCGQIQTLGAWVLRQACLAAAGPLQGLRVAVNVSPAQLADGDFTATVRRVLHEARIDASRLELEITESLFMGDVPEALAQLHALRGLGVRVALDDFGTGYSSLAYLRRFPFDTLKIDRAFVHEMLQREDARAIVQMMLQLASTLGMRTVAEGVETEDQLSALAQAGCHEVQGYLVSRPLTLTALADLRASWAAPARCPG